MMIPDFAELCLMLFVMIDDHYRALPPDLKPRGEQAECSDSELLTMLVVSECMGWQRETEHVSQWARHRDLFPHQPERTRLNRRRRALVATLATLRGRVLAALDLACDRQCAVDSLPVPVMGYHLVPGAHNAGNWRSWGADVGWIASKKQHLFGYRLHLLVTLGGAIRDYVLAPPRPTMSQLPPNCSTGTMIWWCWGTRATSVPRLPMRCTKNRRWTCSPRPAAMRSARHYRGGSRYGTGCGMLPRGHPWKR